MESLLKDYSVVTEIPVAWGEMDALNHVNNAVYFRYFETARLDYFSHINLMEDMAVTNIGQYLGKPIAAINCLSPTPIHYLSALELLRYKKTALRWNIKWSARSLAKSPRRGQPRSSCLISPPIKKP